MTLTENAISQIKALQAQAADYAGKPLRVYVEGGGCSGFQYGMVFDDKREGDHAVVYAGTEVVVDAASVPSLKGAVVDYQEGHNGGFRISNPNARRSCGCGQSFEA